METQTTPRKTFKDVHAEIESESAFLAQNHDVNGFKAKADFLSSAGFGSSIATRMYGAISENADIISDYNTRYFGLYKFLLQPQLERVCEKYNLFVRGADWFITDIPEKNIKDMMNFKVDVYDLFEPSFFGTSFSFAFQHVTGRDWIEPHRHTFELDGRKPKVMLGLNEVGALSNYIFAWSGRYEPLVQIAAIEQMFDPRAFEHSRNRILDANEATAKGQVDLDPVVLVKVLGGYLVVTAWGDEANDELIFNPVNN